MPLLESKVTILGATFIMISYKVYLKFDHIMFVLRLFSDLESNQEHQNKHKPLECNAERMNV